MPPPSWTGISSPTSARIALTAPSLTGLPANAPFRSTRWRRRAPASIQRRAIAAGFSLKTVESFMSPCFRRTQRPSFRSIAGIRSMAASNGGQPDGRGSRRPWARRGPDAASRIPVQEVAVQGQPECGALFRMELRRENIIARKRRGKAATVVGFANTVARVGRARLETVHEVEVAGVGNTPPDRVRPGLDHLVPAHLRHLETAAVGLDLALEAKAHHFAADQAEAGRAFGHALFAALEQHLHADAHAHQRLPAGGVENR